MNIDSSEVKYLEKLIKLEIQSVNTNIAVVIDKVNAINGRVSKTEGKVEVLQRNWDKRKEDCPNGEDIKLLKKKYIEEVGIEAYVEELQKEQAEKDAKRDRDIKTYIAVAMGLFTLVTYIINYFKQ